MQLDTNCEALNRLWVIHHYSLPRYLSFASPGWQDDDGKLLPLIRDVAIDQQHLAERIRAAVLEHCSGLPQGRFPDRFAAFNDLSTGYLWSEVLSYQQRTVAAIEKLQTHFPRASILRALAQETLGMAKAHLDSIQEVRSDGSRFSS